MIALFPYHTLGTFYFKMKNISVDCSYFKFCLLPSVLDVSMDLLSMFTIYLFYCSGLSNDELERIWNLELVDVITEVTGVGYQEIQKNIFLFTNEDSK